jgi:transcriptional regulator with XRE-family HTH domain
VGSGPPPSTGAARRAELADFLKARRAALQPEHVGLTPSGRRRTPGLRREEVADLAGVGLSWYTWLEQARDITPSVQVLEAIGRALQLSGDEREHLFTLAGAGLPAVSKAPDLDPAIVAMIDALAPHPAYVLDDRFDVLAHNRPAEFVLTELLSAPPERRNLLLWLFAGRSEWGDELRSAWEATARANLLDFRTAHAAHAEEATFVALVRELMDTGGVFRTWWAEHGVAALEPTDKTMHHHELGALHFSQLQTRLGTDPALRLRVLVPRTPATRRIMADRYGQ